MVLSCPRGGGLSFLELSLEFLFPGLDRGFTQRLGRDRTVCTLHIPALGAIGRDLGVTLIV